MVGFDTDHHMVKGGQLFRLGLRWNKPQIWSCWHIQNTTVYGDMGICTTNL